MPKTLPGALSLTGLIFFIVSIIPAFAAAPPPREQVSLNGTWTFTPLGSAATSITVPGAWDAETRFRGVSQATYERTITIPAAWTGKRVQLEFDGVNHITSAYINNQKVIDTHLGGWISFKADITSLVTPGSAATIKVEVKGGNQMPIVDAGGNPAWPVGWSGHGQQWGILFDVNLRAYGSVSIQDTYVQTSVTNHTLTATHTITNTTAQAQTVSLSSVAQRNNTTELSLPAQTITVPAHASVTQTLTQTWSNPALWNPKTPHLYHLVSTLSQNSTPLDQATTRFGFRELTISGNRIYLNGSRLNLWGDSMNTHAQGFRNNYVTESTWPATVDKLLARNIRVLRPHQQPAPPYVLDIADEKGLLIIEESPLYARPYLTPGNKATYLQNAHTWIKDWVIARRNHPALIKWNAENELGYGTGYINWLTNAELLALGNRIREYDSTRPVGYDGDRDVGDALYDQHYPEGYDAAWSGSIYRLSPGSKPHGIGEFLTDYGPANNKWWQGTATRGLRYQNFSDIRPYTLFWAWDKALTDPQVINLKNSFAPIGLFDYDYDDLNLAPLISATYPSYNEGTTLTRDAVLYNDDFTDPTVTVQFDVYVNSTLYATGNRTGTLALGEHVKFPYSFQVPNQGGNRMTLKLSTFKQGSKTYEEDIYFNITEVGTSGPTNNAVTINWNSPILTPTGVSGDSDNDRDVDHLDLLTLLKDFGRSLTALIDWNRNGTVDIYDFNVVISKLI